MAGNGKITIPRVSSQAQPSAMDTKKSQKRYTQTEVYDPHSINTEFDYLHERLNQIVTEDPALADLASTATLANVIVRLNALADTLRKAGLLRSS